MSDEHEPRFVVRGTDVYYGDCLWRHYLDEGVAARFAEFANGVLAGTHNPPDDYDPTGP